MGDVVDVKPGYARNFLLPQGKAKSASDSKAAIFDSDADFALPCGNKKFLA